MGLASATHRRRHRDILEIIFFSFSPFVFNIQEKTKSLHSLHLTIHNTDLLTCVLSSTLTLLTLPRDILIHNVDGTTSLDYRLSSLRCYRCYLWLPRGGAPVWWMTLVRGLLLLLLLVLLVCSPRNVDANYSSAVVLLAVAVWCCAPSCNNSSHSSARYWNIFSDCFRESNIWLGFMWISAKSNSFRMKKMTNTKNKHVSYLLSIYCLKRCSAGRVPLDTWTHGLSHRNAATWAKYCI